MIHATNGEWVRLFRALEDAGALARLSEDCQKIASFMPLWPSMKTNTEWQNAETSETSRGVFTILLDHLLGVHLVHEMVPEIPDEIFTEAMAHEMAEFYYAVSAPVSVPVIVIDAGSVN